MKQLTTNLKNYILITFTRSKYYITPKQAEDISKMGSNEKIILDGATINTSSIAEILSLEDYYNSHPEERPKSETPEFKPPEDIPYSAKRHLNALKSIRRGFVKHFDGREMSIGQKEMLKRMDNRIKNFKVGDRVSPGEIFFGDKS